MHVIWFFTLFLVAACAHAKVEDHFKPIGVKEIGHSMPGIDYIYMINLDHQEEKFARSADQLAAYGIYPYRFSAIYGRDLSFETINDLGIVYAPTMQPGIKSTTYFINEAGEIDHRHELPMKTFGVTYYSHCMAKGPIAIILSHLSVLQDAYDSGYKTIWVMEDDIDVISDPTELSTFIQRLDIIDPQWDILFTDIDTKNNDGQLVPCDRLTQRPNCPAPKILTRSISPEFTRIQVRYGAYSMIVRRDGAKKILDFFKTYKLFLPYDMDMFFTPNLRIYRTNKEIVSTRINSPSDNC